MTGRGAPLLILTVLLAAFVGCADKDAPLPGEPSNPLEGVERLDYNDVISRYNQRTDLIKTVWASAVVDVEYDTDDGRQWDQGNGHFQFVPPNQLALSVGKLGEIMYWVGGDGERFWFFELREEDAVYYGRADADGRRAAMRLGWPILPNDLIQLTGMVSLPDSDAIAAAGLTADAYRDGDHIVLFWSDSGAPVLRMALEADTLHPDRIRLYDAAGDSVLRAELSDYTNLEVSGMGGGYPRVATNIRIFDKIGGSRVVLRLDRLREKKLSARIFELDHLIESLGVDEQIDLDREEP